MWLRSDPIVAFASATGAGDAFVAGSIHSLLREPSDAADRELRAFRHGIENARAALMRPGA
jgi:sugar/nucleoside kinase (ribokinase family)